MATPMPRKLNGIPTPIAPNAVRTTIAKKDATMIATAIMTTMTVAMMIVQKARAPGNCVNANQIMPYAADQTFCLKLSHALIFF